MKRSGNNELAKLVGSGNPSGDHHRNHCNRREKQEKRKNLLQLWLWRLCF